MVASKFQAYVKTGAGEKLYSWTYQSGAELDVVVRDADLP